MKEIINYHVVLPRVGALMNFAMSEVVVSLLDPYDGEKEGSQYAEYATVILEISLLMNKSDRRFFVQLPIDKHSP